MQLTPVVSSNLAAVGYDNVQNVLHIQFKGNEIVYQKHGVPLEVYELMMSADSIGSFYARNIKNQYLSQPLPEVT
ncbi:MAG: KTSC domain-containing protein [Paenibacillaceae bacterium]